MSLFFSDGHVAFYFVIDYKVVTFDRCSRRPFLCPMETACFIQIVDCQAIRVFNVFPMALFLSDGHVAFYFVIDYKVVTFWLVFPSALFLSDGHGVQRDDSSQKVVFTF